MSTATLERPVNLVKNTSAAPLVNNKLNAAPAGKPAADAHPTIPGPKARTQYIAIAAAVLVGLAIQFFLPATNGLTDLGVSTLAVIIPGIMLWLTVGVGWPSLVILGMLVVVGAITPGQAWTSSLGNPTIAMVLIFSFIAQGLADVGVIDSVTTWFLTRKFLRGRPYAFMATLLFSHVFLGLWMQGLALGVIYIDLVTRMCAKIGVKKGHPLYTVLVQGAVWAHGVLNVASPVAGTWPLMVIGLLAAMGINITFGMWFAVGIPFAMLAFGAMMIATRIAKPDVTPLLELDMDEFTRNSPKMSKRGKVASLIAIVMLLAVLAPDLLGLFGILPGISGFFSRVGIHFPAIIGLAAMCIARVDGKPIMDFDKTVKTAPLGILIFLGAAFAIAGPLQNADMGITAWMRAGFEPILGGLPPMLVMGVAVTIAVIMTNFISNGVTLTLFWALGSAILMGTGANLAAFGFVIAAAANLAVLTQPATPITALAFTPTGEDLQPHVTLQNTWKANVVFLIVATAILWAMIPLASNILPNITPVVAG